MTEDSEQRERNRMNRKREELLHSAGETSFSILGALAAIVEAFAKAFGAVASAIGAIGELGALGGFIILLLIGAPVCYFFGPSMLDGAKDYIPFVDSKAEAAARVEAEKAAADADEDGGWLPDIGGWFGSSDSESSEEVVTPEGVSVSPQNDEQVSEGVTEESAADNTISDSKETVESSEEVQSPDEEGDSVEEVESAEESKGILTRISDWWNS